VKVYYACPNCQSVNEGSWEGPGNSLQCLACGYKCTADAIFDEEGALQNCVVCGSHDLFVRKDFPQRLGISIVVIGFILSTIAWYMHYVLWSFAALFATAFVDLILFFTMGNLLECYRCHAQIRGTEQQTRARPFDLEIHERYRQQAARRA
jgi:hypothetical protein